MHAWYGLGYFYGSNNQLDKAIEYLKGGLKQDNLNNPHALRLLAEYLKTAVPAPKPSAAD